ncbi:MAG: ATP-binding protein [Deltaproteobacteria bacterium]|nr:ATP-binding protein [Deltaproteobacteria bacterium]
MVIYFARAIDAELLAWVNAPDRKPLVLRGARQTGKTAAVRQLGQQFDLFIELNLERYEDRRLVDACRSAGELLVALQVRHNVARCPPRTLLFLDEVQESTNAVQWLRFLYEDHPELAVVAAGSLMEVRLQERGFSFPVGRVTFRYLHPFSFGEFLAAVGKDVLGARLHDAAVSLCPLPASLHDESLALLRDYLLVGGMPEAVRRWALDRSPVAVRQVHADLVQAFAEDLHKYRGVRDLAYLEAAFDHLRHHYGRRFKYESFAPGFPSHQMKTALGRLEGAMVCRRIWPTSSVSLPLQIRARAAPKLLPLDVGLALASLAVPFLDLHLSRLDDLLDGRVAEIVVGSELLAGRVRTDEPILFWASESARGAAEIDYLAAGATGLLPVEVKAGAGGSLKSLHQFLWRSGLKAGVRLYSGPLADERLQVAMPGGTLCYRLVSLPLYLAAIVPELDLRGPQG